MHKETYNLIRAAVLVLIIAIVVVLCITDASRASSYHPEPTTTASTKATETTRAPEPPTIPTEEQEPTHETEPTTAPTEPVEATKEEPTTDTKPTEKEPTYTEDELEMLAIVIYREAGGNACSDETRLMVGTVVMNRIQDKRFPNTMYKVLTQKSQYGRMHWTGVVWPKRASNPGEANAVKRAYAIAERILQGERALPEDVVFQAEFKQGKKVVAYQDGMYFCS